MRIAFTSDTHNQVSSKHAALFEDVRHADLLVHCGDATTTGSEAELRHFASWFKSLPCTGLKIYVPGNHDRIVESDEVSARRILGDEIICLVNETININGLIFYGSPYTPRFGPWAFMRDRGKGMAEIWAQIPPCDVLITHGPPWGVRDWSIYSLENVGCEQLALRVQAIKPKIHAFGHIHDGYGSSRPYNSETLFINAACCNEQYRPTGRPLLAEIEEP